MAPQLEPAGQPPDARRAVGPGSRPGTRLRDGDRSAHGTQIPPARPTRSAAADEQRDAGLNVLLAFLAAALVMVGAVALVAVVGRWWVLLPVMCIDVAAASGVLACVAWLLRDDGESP
jgi:hypothetical protein